MTRAPKRWLGAAAAAALLASPAAAQDGPGGGDRVPLRVSSAVAPETVTVGDRFRSVIQVVAPAGATVEFAPLPVGDTLQPVDSVRVIPGRAGEPPIGAYTLVAWVAGAPLRAEAAVRVALPDGSAATYLVPLRLPVVRSVLPADTAGVEPRPARGLFALPQTEETRWWLLLVPLAVLVALAWYLSRRRAAAAADTRSPRERALADLKRLGAEAGGIFDPNQIYPAITRVLRRYLAELRREWGTDLTTTELLQRLSVDAVPGVDRARLESLLQHADRVKFARYVPSAGEVEDFLERSRKWVESYPPPEGERAGHREAA